MTRRIPRSATRLGLCLPLLAACFALSASSTARAAFVVSVQNVTVAAGTTGGSLDVVLMNTGPGSATIGGFSFELTVANTAITFTGVTTSTAASPYIFGGLGLVGPNIGTVVTGQDIMASDLFSVIGSGTTLGSGVSVGLGHVRFNVSSSASAGVNAVQIVGFPATSLSDASFNNISITTLTNGSITVGTQSVPEPASIGLVVSGVALSAVFMARRRRRAG